MCLVPLLGLRDRALIGLMGYTFSRVGAAVTMRVEDYYVQGRRCWIRLHEKGGKVNEMPAHHRLEEFLDAYIDRAGIAGEPLVRCDRQIRTATAAKRRRKRGTS